MVTRLRDFTAKEYFFVFRRKCHRSDYITHTPFADHFTGKRRCADEIAACACIHLSEDNFLGGAAGEWVRMVDRIGDLIAIGSVVEALGSSGTAVLQPRIVFKGGADMVGFSRI